MISAQSEQSEHTSRTFGSIGLTSFPLCFASVIRLQMPPHNGGVWYEVSWLAASARSQPVQICILPPWVNPSIKWASFTQLTAHCIEKRHFHESFKTESGTLHQTLPFGRTKVKSAVVFIRYFTWALFTQMDTLFILDGHNKNWFYNSNAESRRLIKGTEAVSHCVDQLLGSTRTSYSFSEYWCLFEYGYFWTCGLTEKNK